MGDASERDWTEDFGLDNGNYFQACFNCRQTFAGHKRRVICKACDRRSRPQGDSTAIEPTGMQRKKMEFLTARGGSRFSIDPDIVAVSVFIRMPEGSVAQIAPDGRVTWW